MIGIVGHINRLPQVEALAGEVGAEYVSIDDGTLGCTANHLKVLRHLAEQNTTWSVALEDDALPINNFRQHLAEALTQAPAPIVSLYLGTGYPKRWQPSVTTATQQADDTQAAWITSNRLLHAVGYAIHTEVLQDLFVAVKTTKPIDEAITTWAMQRRHTVAYTWPSIIDHHDLPTLFQHNDGRPRNQPRIAHRCGVPNWNTNTVSF